jgi:hypothetical protein
MFGFFRRKPAQPAGPDFSEVDSSEKAEALFQQGRLEKLFLRPPCFGGADDPFNTLYVPVGTAALKDRIDTQTVAVLAEEGKVTQYSAKPEYQGSSVIPIAITVRAFDPGSFTTTIKIWGEALKRDANAGGGTGG